VKRISLLILLLLPLRSLLACDFPNGTAVATPATTPACSQLYAAAGLNEQSALGVYAQWNVGFGIITGDLTGAPISLNGGYMGLPSEIDQVVAVPSIATDGTDFLLVEYSSGVTYSRIVHPNGTKGPRVQITNGSGSSGNSSGSAAVVWTGNEYLVAANEFVKDPASNQIVPHIVNAVVARDGTLVSKGSGPSGQLLLTVVPMGSQSLMIWKEGTAVNAGWISAGPTPAILLTLSGINNPSRASSASIGNSIAIAFVNGGALQVLTAARPPASAALSNVSIKTLGSNVNDAAVVADGSDFLVLYSDSSLNANATRISQDGNVGATFPLAKGDVVSAASNSRGTVVLSTYGCGTIQSQFIARGATTASAPVDLTLKPVIQRAEKLVATASGHQLAYLEGTALYVQPVNASGSPGGRTKLADVVQSYALIPTSNGGTAIAWVEGATSNVLRVLRFDANGNPRGSALDIPATPAVNTVSLAETGDTLLVAYQGIVAATFNTRPEVHGVIISSAGTIAQDAVLSNTSDEGNDVTAGVDGSKWMIAWRNGRGGQVAVVETPQSDLRSQTRRDLNLPATGTASIGAVSNGNVYWYELGADSRYVVHRTTLTGTDAVLGTSFDEITNLRLSGTTPVWTSSGATLVSISSPSGLLGCFAMTVVGNNTFEYDIRNGVVSTFVYFDGTQLRVQNQGDQLPPPPASRHRAVHH
jgi:hypothetical protein